MPTPTRPPLSPHRRGGPHQTAGSWRSPPPTPPRRNTTSSPTPTRQTPQIAYDKFTAGQWTAPPGTLIVVDDADHLTAEQLHCFTENAVRTNTKLLLVSTPTADREPTQTLVGALATNLPWAQHIGTPGDHTPTTAIAQARRLADTNPELTDPAHRQHTASYSPAPTPSPVPTPDASPTAEPNATVAPNAPKTAPPATNSYHSQLGSRTCPRRLSSHLDGMGTHWREVQRLVGAPGHRGAEHLAQVNERAVGVQPEPRSTWSNDQNLWMSLGEVV